MDPTDPKNPKHLDDFVAEHAPLIEHAKNILKKQLPKHLDMEGLHSAGLDGLMHAVAKYDPEVASRFVREGENPFIKHAMEHVIGKMRDYLKTSDPIHRVARQKAKSLEHLKNAELTEQAEAAKKAKEAEIQPPAELAEPQSED